MCVWEEGLGGWRLCCAMCVGVLLWAIACSLHCALYYAPSLHLPYPRPQPFAIAYSSESRTTYISFRLPLCVRLEIIDFSKL